MVADSTDGLTNKSYPASIQMMLDSWDTITKGLSTYDHILRAEFEARTHPINREHSYKSIT